MGCTRTGIAAAVVTVVVIGLVVVGAFLLGLWTVRGAVTSGQLNCADVVPFGGQARPVPPARAGYDPDLAVALVQFVSAAYGAVCGAPVSAVGWLTTPDGATWRRVGVFRGVAAPAIGGGSEEVYGYAWLGAPRGAPRPGEASVLVFAFRGTLSLAGWVADFDFPQQPSAVVGGLVHRGFDNLYGSMRAAVLATARRYPGARVLVSGHSLGGALATLAAADVGTRGGRGGGARAISVYTYGCPRVGDAAFVRAAGVAAPDNWRVVNTADAIPTVPPPGIDGYAYQHTPRAAEITVQQKTVAGNHSLNGAYYSGLTA